MSIVIPAGLETRLRAQAEAEGLTVEAFIERMVSAYEHAEEELTSLALEGLRSGVPLTVDPGYWQEKHRRLDERMKNGNR